MFERHHLAEAARRGRVFTAEVRGCWQTRNDAKSGSTVLALLMGFRPDTSKSGVEYRKGTLNSSESAPLERDFSEIRRSDSFVREVPARIKQIPGRTLQNGNL